MDSSSRYNFTVIIDLSVFCLLFFTVIFLIVFLAPNERLRWKMASDLHIFCFRLMSLQILSTKEHLWVLNLSPYLFLYRHIVVSLYCRLVPISHYLWFRCAFKTRVWVGLLLAFFFVSKNRGGIFFFPVQAWG